MLERKKWDETGRTSESCFRLHKAGFYRTKKITGYETGNRKKEGGREILRMENSYGMIAFGEKKNKELSILISEKKRHNRPGISSVEKRLKEGSQLEERKQGSRILTNRDSKTSGALAFVYQPGTGKERVMEGMKQYVKDHSQETLKQMLPFLTTEADREKINHLRDISRKLRYHGMLTEARAADQEREEYEIVAGEKSNRERQLNQNLIMAIKELGIKKIRKTDLREGTRVDFGEETGIDSEEEPGVDSEEGAGVDSEEGAGVDSEEETGIDPEEETGVSSEEETGVGL